MKHTPAEVAETGAAHGVTAAQAILRWHLQLGALPLPKSADPRRQRENLDLFGFQLDADQLAAIDGLERDNRLYPHPDEFAATQFRD